jgi:uncharacterized protein (DUF58 family)
VTAAATAAPLLSRALLERLAALDLGVRRAAAGGTLGERAAGRAGIGTIFHEHRTYTPGDDLRYVDWNVFGRLRSMHVKVFEMEETLDVHILLDRSASMGVGPRSKLLAAARAAAAVGAVALARNDTVRLTLLPASGAVQTVYRGRASVHRLLDTLARAQPAAGAPLGRSLEQVLPVARRRGVALLLTDFLDDAATAAPQVGHAGDGWRRSVDYLRYLRIELSAVQVLAPHERDPVVDGPVRLTDAETGAFLDLDADAPALRAYRDGFELWMRGVAAFLRAKEARHLVLDSAHSDEGEVVQRLVRAGVLR